MTHFAEIDENNIVIRVLVIEQDEIDSGEWGNPENWIQTSYNTRCGIHYNHDSDIPSEDQTKSLRKNFAGIGFIYDEIRDAFIQPSLYESWVLNEDSCVYESPIEQPVVNDDQMAVWNEDLLDWVIYGNV
jgi:hypothetical protein